jgi:hypothetical protein
MKKKIPAFRSDKAAERFAETADLSEYDLSGFTRVHFEFEEKTTPRSTRLPTRPA